MAAPSDFVNREAELRALNAWWEAPGGALGLVWGRRRVGKTALIQRFLGAKPAVFHTGGGRPLLDELRILSRSAAPVMGTGVRDLAARPFTDWDDVLDSMAERARETPVLLVLDEFPELFPTSPALPSIIRAFWDRAKSASKLKILLCGSAVRTMQQIQEARSPLYGRMDLTIQLNPFAPHEAAMMLRGLDPPERALVWGLVGGIPLYLSWWDQSAGVKENLASLVCTPGGRLLAEGQLVLATEGHSGDLGGLILKAVAAGRTKHNEIAQAAGAEPSRTLDRLIQLRLLEKIRPVTDDPRRARRRLYRVADNFLSFWLGVVDGYRQEIERGLGASILPALMKDLDDHLGAPWEEAFRMHLRALAAGGKLGDEVVAIGPWWSTTSQIQIDAVALAGRGRKVRLAGEAKWARSIDARGLLRRLEAKADLLPGREESIRYALAAREQVRNAKPGTLTITSRDIFRH